MRPMKAAQGTARRQMHVYPPHVGGQEGAFPEVTGPFEELFGGAFVWRLALFLQCTH